MCGRYALGISIESLPEKFNDTVLNPDQSANTLQPSEEENSSGSWSRSHYETTSSYPEDGSTHTIELNVTLPEFHASYNIPPTGTGVIIYMEKPIEVNPAKSKSAEYRYCIEASNFGLLPVWAKPHDSSRVKKGNGASLGPAYSREVQQHQGKLFNCRRETLQQSRTVWATPRKHTRCVVPVSGYFEWLNSKQGKTPYFVHSPGKPLLFLAGLYSHNQNYNDTEMVPKGSKYFSSFSIVTGPATGKGKNDMSWLHSRKPIFIEPNSKAWFDWLRPDDHWDDSVLETCLNTDTNPVYEDLEWYMVAKSIGNPINKGPEVIKEEKVKQKSIASFFQARGPKEETKKEKEPHNVKDEQKDGTSPEDVQVKLNSKRSGDSNSGSDLKRVKKEET